jgi:hypothetical protein
MNLRPFLRMSQWARNPPSLRRVILGLAVIGLCLAIAGIEWLGLWPDWLIADPGRRIRL